jgi:chromosome segregation protein
MLKALELIGFKSFADKTRFEFPPGITVVVGPNGSGKSNVVDAIKWVLGEQSAKSLRGREMADVIFNGSTGRRAVNTAEITLTLDNADRALAIDTREVHVTRRVYRSGEGEYLINRQPCRLRDIRDLFAGTGVATEAYSVIEQGKVDIMLQSSPRDRRLIFEEAAGISRFKAKKIEAQRRMERVDQNLLRLSDIVEEVESRLRSVRMQAAKARRYREYSQRLQDLRTQVALVDWRRLTEQLTLIQAELDQLREEAASSQATAERLEADALAIEVELVAREQTLRQSEGQFAANREAIAATESFVEHERVRGTDLEQEAVRHRRQLATVTTRASDLDEQHEATRAEAIAAQRQYEECFKRAGDDERALSDLGAQLDKLRGQTGELQLSYLTQLRAATALGGEISALEMRVSTAETLGDRCRRRIAELTTMVAEATSQATALVERESVVVAAQESARRQLEQCEMELALRREATAAAQRELIQLEGRLVSVRERAALLEELEARQEGISAGVRQVLAASRTAIDGPLRNVRGLLAELISVNVELAGLIDAALEDAAGYLVVEATDDFFDLLVEQTYRFEGRVGFLPLVRSADPPNGADLTPKPGVLGRADRFVQTESQYEPLVRSLLGQTWIVESLSHALALVDQGGPQARLVTRAGEVVGADGTLLVGPRQSSIGLVSRRSELRSLRRELEALQSRREDLERRLAAFEAEVTALEQQQIRQQAAHREAMAEAARHELALQTARDRMAEVERQLSGVQVEQAAAQTEHEAAATALAAARQRLASLESSVASIQSQLEWDRRQMDELDARRAALQQAGTAAQIDLAKCEQRLDDLRAQVREFESHRQERDRLLVEHHQRLEDNARRQDESQRNILQAESRLADLYVQKEELARQIVSLGEEREGLVARRSECAASTQRLRTSAAKLQRRVHEQELLQSDLVHQRTTLADRLREDYAIELGELEQAPSPEELNQREAVEQEIADLRRKINLMGGVNLDALAELDELEARHAHLSAQHQDLSEAKAALESIIERINADSRRLFAETLETVRGHFQQLFRKLFGGGQADIVVEEGADILDGGIEILARPPGKEPRSISLLSGGEKTLTCVALLLAIFRSKPSPFCVLDEVDAALDEANIERFVAVLKEFLAITQFIVVTHSKKTMTAADTLYGITMQESGISKRVSVRFEDVSETGEISRAAIERGANDPSPRDEESQAA